MRFALVILTFVHGSPAKFDGFVASIFEHREYCCQSLDLFAKGQDRYQSVALCLAFTADIGRDHEPPKLAIC